MKKKVLLLALLLSFSAFAQSVYYEGAGGKNHTIIFADSTLENGIYDKSDVWVTDKIRMNLIVALNKYAGFNCIDLNEAKNIIKVQKHFESGIYDESQPMEIGKLIRAKEIVNIKTTRLPSGTYSINVSIFNVETGEIIGMFSSPKTYESAETYAFLAQYDCVPDILAKFGIGLNQAGKNAFESEKRIALEQAEKNKILAKENAKLEAEQNEKARLEAERRAKIEAEEREKREAREKAEEEANRKALAEKKALEAEARRKAKLQNPFANEIYSCEFENGSRYDKYKVNFVSQNECNVTVTSVDSKGEEKSFSQNGTYSFGNNVLSINVRMPNQQVKHVQKIQWKGQVTFKNGYNTFYLMIPVNSNEEAKKVRAEFMLK